MPADDSHWEPASQIASPVEQACASEMRERIMRECENMDEATRRYVDLAIEGNRPQQIALLTGDPVTAVYQCLYKARRMLEVTFRWAA